MSDQAKELCLRLQEDTLERIRADRQGASVQVARLLAMIEEHLLDPDLTVEALRRWCGEQDKNISTRFAAELGLAPWAYILLARMELGGRMLTASKLMVWQIGLQVGYDSGNSFGRAFKRWSGQTPSEFRQKARAKAVEEAPTTPAEPTELVHNAELLEALAGDLAIEDADKLVTRLEDILGGIRGVYQPFSPQIPTEHSVEPVMARNLWGWIEDLPYEVQQRAIESQAPAFHTAALFHVLCTESIEAGEEDDDRGHQILGLALSCLPVIGERMGKDSLHVFARAYTVAGLAFRRSGDLDEAARNLSIAFRMLNMTDEPHPAVVAELCLYQAMLEVERDDLEMAEKLSNQAIAILEKLVEKYLGRSIEPPPQGS